MYDTQARGSSSTRSPETEIYQFITAQAVSSKAKEKKRSEKTIVGLVSFKVSLNLCVCQWNKDLRSNWATKRSQRQIDYVGKNGFRKQAYERPIKKIEERKTRSEQKNYHIVWLATSKTNPLFEPWYECVVQSHCNLHCESWIFYPSIRGMCECGCVLGRDRLFLCIRHLTYTNERRSQIYESSNCWIHSNTCVCVRIGERERES